MDTKELSRERISALADGELEGEQVDLALAALRSPEARTQWDEYHRIGDVLRSSDMAREMSAGFATRMAAALEREPAIVAPAAAAQRGKREARRWLVPGMAAAAAAAAVAFVVTPHLMVVDKEGAVIATGAMPVQAKLADAPAPQLELASAPVVPAAVPEGVVLRDARMDDYLLAHQRFSPSVFGAAQYARSATFAAEPHR